MREGIDFKTKYGWLEDHECENRRAPETGSALRRRWKTSNPGSVDHEKMEVDVGEVRFRPAALGLLTFISKSLQIKYLFIYDQARTWGKNAPHFNKVTCG